MVTRDHNISVLIKVKKKRKEKKTKNKNFLEQVTSVTSTFNKK